MGLNMPNKKGFWASHIHPLSMQVYYVTIFQYSFEMYFHSQHGKFLIRYESASKCVINENK